MDIGMAALTAALTIAMLGLFSWAGRVVGEGSAKK